VKLLLYIAQEEEHIADLYQFFEKVDQTCLFHSRAVLVAGETVSSAAVLFRQLREWFK
jgi:hypothetical protein